MRLQLLILITIWTISNPANAQTVRCDIGTKFACIAASGCNDNPPGVWNVIDFTTNSFSRCDKNGCDTYEMSPTRSGLYISIDVPGHGMFAKMSADGSQYTEAVSLGTDVLVSFGSCR